MQRSALSWIKPELNAALKQSRANLENFSEGSADLGALEKCAMAINTVSNVLQKAHLAGGELLASTIKDVISVLRDKPPGERKAAQQRLMEAILKLDKYLERIIGGHPDIPIVLFPTVNDLRSSVGLNMLSEEALFAPDLHAAIPSNEAQRIPPVDLRSYAKRLRSVYQQGLLVWLRGSQQGLALLQKVIGNLGETFPSYSFGRVWWAAQGLAEALYDGGLETDDSIKSFFREGDRQLKHLAEGGDPASEDVFSPQTLRTVLYHVMRARSNGEHVQRIRAVFGLNVFSVRSDEVQRAIDTFLGPDCETITAVAKLLQEEIKTAKGTLEIYAHSDQRSIQDLHNLVPILDRLLAIFDTLGLSREHNLIADQMSLVKAGAALRTTLGQDKLQIIADGLLRIESALKHLEACGFEVGSDDDTGCSTDTLRPRGTLSTVELGQIRALIAKEAKENLTVVKNLLRASGTSKLDRDQIANAVRLLEQMSDSLGMAELGEASQVITALSSHLSKSLATPGIGSAVATLQALAEAVIGIEDYLHALAEQQQDAPAILKTAVAKLETLPVQNANSNNAESFATSVIASPSLINGPRKAQVPSPLDALGTPFDGHSGSSAQCDSFKHGSAAPVKDGAFALAQSAGHAARELAVPVGDLQQATSVAVENAHAESPELAPNPIGTTYSESAPSLGRYQTLASESHSIDVPCHSELPREHAPRLQNHVAPQIAQIFWDEAQGLLETIQNALLKWKRDPGDADALTTTHRALHTLKGSSRLVGAEEISRLSRSVENLLDRLIDGTLEAKPSIFSLMDEVLTALPPLLESHRTGQSGDPDIASLVSKLLSFSDPTGRDWTGCQSHSSTKMETNAQTPPEPMRGTMTPAETLPATQLGNNANFGFDNTDLCRINGCGAGSTAHQHARNISNKALTTNISPARPTVPEMSIMQGGMPGLPRLLEYDSPEPIESTEPDAAVLAQESITDVKYSISATGECVIHERTVEAAVASASAPDTYPRSSEVELLSSVVQSDVAETDTLGKPSEVDRLAEVRPDPVLVGLFVAEARVHISVLNDFLECCQQHENASLVDEKVSWALHTLHGNARTAGIEPIMHLVVEIETHLKEWRELGLTPRSIDCRAIASAIEQIGTILSSLENGERTPPDKTDPQFSIAASAPTRPHLYTGSAGTESSRASQKGAFHTAQKHRHESDIQQSDLYDYDLIGSFLEEAAEILDLSDPLLDKWRKTPDDQGVIHELQRNLHTLKGGARMSGVGPMGDLSHALESVLAAAHEERLPVTEELIGHVQHAVDRLLEMLQKVCEQISLQPADDLIRLLNEFLDNREQALGEPWGTRQTGEETSDENSILLNDQAAEEEPCTGEEIPVAKSRSRDRRFSAQVRVNPALVEKVANLGGEVSIVRARIGQQISVLRFNLKEMDETVERLREQLRRMEIETEAQVRFRHEQTSVEQEQFDPLELDRYSQVQQLSRSLMESVSDLLSLRDLLEGWTSESETLLLQQARAVTELQQGLMAMRLVPFSGIVPKMRHLVRQTARELDKKVQLRVTGAETEIDRTVLNRLASCLEHMLRNAIDHGIESEDLRTSQGKASEGTISISVMREASEILLTIEDDGAGLPFEHIQKRCVEGGWIHSDEKLDHRQLAQFILKPTFSTASKLSQISGRGVGMDVVNTEIAQLGGNLEIDSKSGQGTRFSIRLPFSLNVTQAFMVQVDGAVFAIPHDSVEAVLRLSQLENSELSRKAFAQISHRGQTYRFWHLGQLLGCARGQAGSEVRSAPVLLVRAAEHRAAFQVDELSMSEEILIKPVGPMLASIRWLTGAAILPDGRVVLVLDMPSLVRLALVESRHVRSEEVTEDQNLLPAKQAWIPTVLVVDDSITVRKVTARLLESHGMRVLTAKDGIDAISALQNDPPDIMLLDIEMPRMDGYEVATKVRQDSRLKQLPIIMITSRTGEKHRERALKIGVDRYLGKPYGEQELITGIQELLAGV
ncbi:MAG: Hpt domain-containing protein [Gammaproteobacteria bacterium]